MLSINGDGGFMFNAQELSTAVQQGLGVVAVVFEDGAYGNVKRMQEDLYGGRVTASELHNPDFVKLAESFGAAGVRADSPGALRDAVTAAWGRRIPTVVSVSVGRFPDPFRHGAADQGGAREVSTGAGGAARGPSSPFPDRRCRCRR